MAKFLILGKYTQQGVKTVEETTKRADLFKEIAAEYGIEVLDIFWLIGEYDVVNIVDAPDDESLKALLLRVDAWGNVTTTAIRAFDKGEMEEVLKRMRA
ncbi:MAG: GYD domain-containing protein [Nitrospinae bacterium]|nr:GYD domain-containing protein [Nitrospinota bacterium]